MPISPTNQRRLRFFGAAAIALAATLAIFVWYELFRVVPEDEAILRDPAMKFKYGSLGAEGDRGIPYLVWLVLPRIFPDLLPGPGGYKSFGLVWEEGQEMPVGFVKKTIGVFPRVTNNCALCHATTWRASESDVTHVVPAGGSHTADVQGMIRFLSAAANDPRFNADRIMSEIQQVNDNSYGNGGLSWVDRQVYRWLLIPFTRMGLRSQESLFAWMNRPGKPDWGPGRDDPMNLTKYFMTNMPEDSTVGQADFPSIWNLKVRKGPGLLLNWSGDTPAVRSVLIDSALGLGAPPEPWFLDRMAELDDWLSNLPPPKYPFPIDAAKAAAGRPIYEAHCASCHEPGRELVNKIILLSEIGTDPERARSWSGEAAKEANRRVREMGIDRPPMVETDPTGYQSPPLDGIWLRAPYLHNGAVPTLRDLLAPEAQRPAKFRRGYDVYDPLNVGFESASPEARRRGFLHDTAERGNGNLGHLYGTNLSEPEKAQLLEYLKTL
jgi:mono/diheme cytochrome c family protein